MRQTVVGIFDSTTEAQHAVEKLGNSGFTIDQVDLTLNSRSSLENTVNDDDTVTRKDDDDDSFGERVSRFFRNLFDDDEDETTKYSRVARNAALVTVIADSEEDALRASSILDDCGAVDVDERYSELQRSGLDTEKSTSRTNYDSTNRISGEFDEKEVTRDRFTGDDDLTNKSIPIIEEELHIEKREIERGGVRIRSRIVEKPVEETVRLREETLRVDRNTVNRPATDRDLSTFREGEIEVRERAEVPVVNKEARVVEEINLNKDVREREETIRDTVRRTEVDIDKNDVEEDVSVSKRKRKDKL